MHHVMHHTNLYQSVPICTNLSIQVSPFELDAGRCIHHRLSLALRGYAHPPVLASEIQAEKQNISSAELI